ncbi:Rho GTPase [Cadophora gregata f. sp. sojae]|nr:Rho GTPase [Cadophora gregata f. sp. sojae]
MMAEDEKARAAAKSRAEASVGTSLPSGHGRDKKNPTIKLVVVGDPGKLKQYLLVTYVTNKYPTEYVLPVFDNYAVTVMIGDEPYTLGIFDTTGQESYERLRPLSYPQTDVFMIVISTSNRSHYKSARDTWAPELKLHCPGVPFLLVGIQDPPNDALDTASRKKARVDEGKKLAREIGAVQYVECELKTQKGVKDVFDEAIVAALDPRAAPKKRRRSRLRLLARIEED